MNAWHSTQKESVISGLLRFGVRKNWEPCAIRYTEDGFQPWIACPKSRPKDRSWAITDSQVAIPGTSTLVGFAQPVPSGRVMRACIEEWFYRRVAAPDWLFLYRQGTTNADEENSEVRIAARQRLDSNPPFSNGASRKRWIPPHRAYAGGSRRVCETIQTSLRRVSARRRRREITAGLAPQIQSRN